MPECHNLPIQPITGRPRLVAEMQSAMALLEPAHEFADRGRIGVDLAKIPHLPLSACLRNRHRMLLLGNIHPHKNCAIVLHGSSPCAEARLALCEQPSMTRTVCDEPPN